MTRIIMSGCNGKMGRVITNLIDERQNCEIVAGLDIRENADAPYPVFTTADAIDVEADVIIDFSNPSALDALLSFATRKNLPAVLCTTGFSQPQVEQIKAASEEIPIFFSGNMSLGINLLIDLAKKAAVMFGDSFDIEIVEKHHNQKIDAPSGTALMIADALSNVKEQDMHYVYDRHSYRKARGKNEIGIHSVRGGTIVGEHDVIFAGHDEVFTISHSAQSKEIFAAGSINAAVYLKGKPAGLYNMSDMLSDN